VVIIGKEEKARKERVRKERRGARERHGDG
jgi:hypothetical protein